MTNESSLSAYQFYNHSKTVNIHQTFVIDLLDEFVQDLLHALHLAVVQFLFGKHSEDGHLARHLSVHLTRIGGDQHLVVKYGIN